MAALRTLLLLGLLLTARGQRAARRRRPPPPQSALEKVAAQEALSLHQLSGKWFLVGMASRCSYLAEHSHQLEATTVTMTILDGQSLAISTFRKLDRMCWEIRQHYLPAQAPGRFLLKGHRKSSKVDVVVGEADPSSFIILYYQKGRSISVKLYGRSSRVSDAVVDKFEQRARAVGLSQDVTYYFPTYGFCDSADEFHVLDGELGMLGDALGAPMCQAWSLTGHQLGVPVLTCSSFATQVLGLAPSFATPRTAEHHPDIHRVLGRELGVPGSRGGFVFLCQCQ
ncbi:complement component C8 gamma chain [Melozone crissalis]|uniref:complement component C8 gamma chain n=1 Tax=Melozone crissalis TaxID=40204 RepID=UPI0023DA2578|nr:complement component C8 gamma chain [Melozone crissalis]